MASSGSFNTGGYQGRYLTFSWPEKSQSIADNTTTISWTLKGAGDAESGWYYTQNIKVVIDGKTVFTHTKDKDGQIKLSNGTVVASGTYTFTHNSVGAKTFTASAEAGIYNWAVNCTGSKTFTLDTIPRKSTLTASNGTLGAAQTLTVTRQASSFTHTITYKCGTASGTICTKSSDTSISWTPPLSLAQQNKTGATVSVTLTITTYNGSTSVGSNTKTITCSIPASVKPSVSVAVSDPLGHAETFGAYVQGQSKLKIVVTASGNQGSTIKSYKVEVDGKTYTTATVETGVIAGTGTLTVKVTVTDSRGRTASSSPTVSVLAYALPKISSLAAFRCDSDGKASSSGAYLAVKFTSAVTSLNSKNTATYTLKYKKSTETSYTTETLSDFAGMHSVSNGVYVFPADPAFSYDITLTVKDAFKSIQKAATGSSVKKVWSMLKKAGEIVGIAINKVAELDGVFDVDMTIRARKGIIVDAEWVDLTISSGFELYDKLARNQPKCKMTGNVVTVFGILTPTADFTSSTTGVSIASGIPSNMRPPINLHFVCQGSGMNRWTCSVNTNGTVTIARYGITEVSTAPVGAWLPFCVTYQI